MAIDPCTHVCTHDYSMATAINTYLVFLDKGGVYEHHSAQICTAFVWLAW